MSRAVESFPEIAERFVNEYKSSLPNHPFTTVLFNDRALPTGSRTTPCPPAEFAQRYEQIRTYNATWGIILRADHPLNNTLVVTIDHTPGPVAEPDRFLLVNFDIPER
ncbi:hypothetical protein [Actinocrispum sp. NPDC049592]|uniref:hypothetical protein n=1 Tax=Actinocrispum sp. NPDC049592 TaxID=3154835 RepID=UPI003438B848